MVAKWDLASPFSKGALTLVHPNGTQAHPDFNLTGVVGNKYLALQAQQPEETHSI